MNDNELITVLKKALEEDMSASVTLTPAEMKRLRSMIETYEMLLSSGRLGRWFVTALIGLSGAIAAAIYIADAVRAALQARGH